ncbi:MAG TPA: hypothetical protein VI854_05210 [Acidimicrobiia bacterium]|nr:hypothetical protein [Acidimicrobiia bacterium]
MAGKAKNKDEGQQSKTARASMRTGGGKESYQASGDVARIVPLGGGTGAYVLDPRNGRTLRHQVGSEDFIEVLIALVDAGYGDRVRRDLSDLVARYPETPWKDVTVRFEGALAERNGESDAA